MKRTLAVSTTLPLFLALSACGGGGGGGGFLASTARTGSTASPAPTTSASTATPRTTPASGTVSSTSSSTTSATPAPAPSPAPTPAVNFAQLAADFQTRKATALDQMVNGFPGQGENIFTEIARLELNQGPLDLGAIDYSLGQMDQRQDCADFGANGALRILYQYASSPLLPAAELQKIQASVVNFRYWVDEPNPCGMTYWSENHQILFGTIEYLAGSLFPQTVFPNSGLTGDQHAQKARARILRWLDLRQTWGMSEWFSPVYYEYDIMPLFNLVDFAPDADIRTRASMVLDLVLFDLARETNNGSMGVTSGRAYSDQKSSGNHQSVGDVIEVLWGTRGTIMGRGSPALASLVTSRGYKVPHALLGIGLDSPQRLTLRSRQGLDFSEAGQAGVGFQSFDDGIVWWGMGAYFCKETVVLSKSMISTWQLQSYPLFAKVWPAISLVPDILLPFVADQLSAVTEGSFLSSAGTTTFRTPDTMLSSVESWREGQVGFQSSAWQATLGMDAICYTTMPGNLGHDGPDDWTGSGSLPRVVQQGNVAVILYNPALAERVAFPQYSHAFFPELAYDEVASQGSWTFGRKGKGYLALYSANATTLTRQGAYALQELVAQGSRNVWICQVGREAEDGSFAAFQSKIAGASLSVVGNGNQDQSQPLHASFAAPGVGQLEVDWSAPPTLGGNTIDESFPRWDTPYVTAPVGAKAFTIQFAGATLTHDGTAGTRTGTGL
jgi:hypothetical protein